MTQEDYLKRRIFLKRQHVVIIKDEIRELEERLKEHKGLVDPVDQNVYRLNQVEHAENK